MTREIIRKPDEDIPLHYEILVVGLSYSSYDIHIVGVPIHHVTTAKLERIPWHELRTQNLRDPRIVYVERVGSGHESAKQELRALVKHTKAKATRMNQKVLSELENAKAE